MGNIIEFLVVRLVYNYLGSSWLPTAAETHLSGTSTLITLLKQQSANGVVCLAGTVIDRQHRLAEHAGRSTIKYSRTSSPNRQIKHFIKLGLTVTQSTVDYNYNLDTRLVLW